MIGILGSSIYIIDMLNIDDLRIDDQSSILRSSICRVFDNDSLLNLFIKPVKRLTEMSFFVFQAM